MSRSIKRDHRVDMLGRARLDIRLKAAKCLRVGLEGRVGFFRQFADRNIPLGGAGVDLVIDVRDVADIGDVILAVEMAQQPVEHIEDDERPRIADMGEVIDRRPADIHAHVGGIDRLEDLLLPGQRIVKLQSHSFPLQPRLAGGGPI